MTKTYNTSDICESAHYLTARDCKRAKITINCHEEGCDECENAEVHYSPKAQVIFQRHFDIIEAQYEANPNLTREE